jgi:hypothetical protein
MIEALAQALFGPLGGIIAGIGAVIGALVLGRWQGGKIATDKMVKKDNANADKIRDKADRARLADDLSDIDAIERLRKRGRLRD